MATVQKFTPPPPAALYKVELSIAEAGGLLALLDDGVDSTTLESLGLRDLLAALRTASVTPNTRRGFDYLAELG